MKVLLIGGTGTISMAITRMLANTDWDVYLLNRGTRKDEIPSRIRLIEADITNEKDVAEKIKDLSFDVVCEFIGFTPSQIERDFRLFHGKTQQYMYISSASAYCKPPKNYCITEDTPLENPYWEYSRNKIACENLLLKLYKENHFPITIIRPSHTYDERNVPLGVHGKAGSWQVIQRMLDRKPVIIHGDGTSLWTMTHNTDFAKAFIGLMGKANAIGETYQITSDETLTWNDIYKTIAELLGVEWKPYYVASDFLSQISDYDFEGSLIGDKSNSVVFDNSKLKAAVPDFVPSVSFQDGMKQTIEYVLTHKECQTPDEEFDRWCDVLIDTLEAAKNHLANDRSANSNLPTSPKF